MTWTQIMSVMHFLAGLMIGNFLGIIVGGLISAASKASMCEECRDSGDDA